MLLAIDREWSSAIERLRRLTHWHLLLTMRQH